MSGGVDSTACALIMREQYQVKGFFMQLEQPNFSYQKERVERIAEKLNIDLKIIDLRQEFNKKVLDYFSGSYFRGLTPNPCVICNREIKFGLFMDAILGAGMDCMATGHYARIVKSQTGYHLHKGHDPKKDQSYFLSRLHQKQLEKILFPLGEQTKDSTYNFVEQHGFDDFRGQESQDVCFLDNSGVGNFLEGKLSPGNSSGPIITTSRKVLGSHNGLYRYTIGQRKGLGVSSETPLYVIGLDVANNAVIVGKNDELFKSHIQVKELHWLSGNPPDTSKEYQVRIRYSHRGSDGRLVVHDDGHGEIIFQDPQRAITPGQFAVIYEDTELLGSGVIE